MGFELHFDAGFLWTNVLLCPFFRFTDPCLIAFLPSVETISARSSHPATLTCLPIHQAYTRFSHPPSHRRIQIRIRLLRVFPARNFPLQRVPDLRHAAPSSTPRLGRRPIILYWSLASPKRTKRWNSTSSSTTGMATRRESLCSPAKPFRSRGSANSYPLRSRGAPPRLPPPRPSGIRSRALAPRSPPPRKTHAASSSTSTSRCGTRMCGRRGCGRRGRRAGELRRHYLPTARQRARCVWGARGVVMRGTRPGIRSSRVSCRRRHGLGMSEACCTILPATYLLFF